MDFQSEVDRVTGLLFDRRMLRELGRREIAEFVEITHPGYQVMPHHELMMHTAMRVEEGDLHFGAVSMPPRHGKSELFSIKMIAHYLGRFPHKQVLHLSYASSLSNEFSRRVRMLIRDDPEYRRMFPHVLLDPERARLDDWKTIQGGGMKSVGAGGGVSGHGADLIIIDDPIKEGDEQSMTTLEQIWTWFASAVRTRLHPGGAVFIVMTRWHPLDLVGQVKALMQSNPEADQYEFIVLPAIALENDILGRSPGEPLWQQRYDTPQLLAIRKMSERYFEALYQQNPQISETPMFIRENFRIEPGGFGDEGGWFWAFDLAASERTRADYTVALRARREGDEIQIDDVRRFRREWPEVKKEILKIYDDHPLDNFVFPTQMLELLALKELVAARSDSNWRVKAVSLPDDKITRAWVMSDWSNAGRVAIRMRGDWDYFITEHCNFPDATQHDDCVDASSVVTHHLGLTRLIQVLTPADEQVQDTTWQADLLRRATG